MKLSYLGTTETFSLLTAVELLLKEAVMQNIKPFKSKTQSYALKKLYRILTEKLQNHSSETQVA